MTHHPARYGPQVIEAILDQLDPTKHRRVLDPFAGAGTIHQLRDHGFNTVGVEIEPRWANLHEYTEKGDATDLRWRRSSFDAVVTSPTYGNRMADTYVPKDADTSKRTSYRISLGKKLNKRNTGGMQWGEAYREMHREAWSEAVRVLRLHGRLLLNFKDHMRSGQLQPVGAWHVHTLEELGLYLVDEIQLDEGNQGFTLSPTRVRCPEMLYVFDKLPKEENR